MKLNCIVIDDEPIARDIVVDYVNDHNQLELKKVCANAIEAYKFLQEESIDLMFLDIQMPQLNGLDFLRGLKNPPMVIFTTAYQEYALDSYELYAVDYLVKPISEDRFTTAVEKALERQGSVQEEATKPEAEQEYLFLKVDSEMLKVNRNDIYYVQGLKDYAQVYLKDKRLITLSTMKHMDEVLASSNFVRVHRSFIINLDKVEAIIGNSFRINDQLITIGKSYLKEIHHLLKEKFDI